ncbi:MAG TPA: 6-phosphogluconolactonase [Spirochaetia bacterium]|nr:6-phosphogluconolactonase [Spirochaetales bacterium]HRY79976.1 6-phosphogluconolactonase [Spirochaetia bacterium]
MEILRFPTEEAWIEAARTAFRTAAAAAKLRGSDTLRLCLAGGRTPEPVYRALARIPLRDVRVELWLGDEREVDPASPDRNGGLVLRAFRDCAWDPAPVFLLWPGGPGTEACRAVEARLAGLAEPIFDLSFLGIGEDGHTAGIFPGGPEAVETSRLAVPSRAPSEPRARMTLSPRALASTRTLLYLLRGPAKLGLAERLAAGPVPDGRAAVEYPPDGPRSGGASGTPRVLLPAELVAQRARAVGADVILSYCAT